MALHQLHREERPTVLEAAQLIDRDDPRMLQLAADLGFLNETADQTRIVAVLLEQDLDGQVPAEVGVATLQNRTHAAPGNLTQKLVALAPGNVGGNLVRGGMDQRCEPTGLGLAEKDAGDAAE